MDKGATFEVTSNFRHALKNLPQRYLEMTDTEKNAIEFADELFKKELAQLQTDPNYKGV